jgi:DNA-binding PadR family transcriptional regulator
LTRQFDAEVAVIAHLQEHGESSGDQIERSLHMSSGRFKPTLRRLEQQGTIGARFEDGPAGKRGQRLYRLTPT